MDLRGWGRSLQAWWVFKALDPYGRIPNSEPNSTVNAGQTPSSCSFAKGLRGSEGESRVFSPISARIDWPR